MLRRVTFLVLLTALLVGQQCTLTPGTDDSNGDGDGSSATLPRVVIETTKGTIVIELFDGAVPESVAFFLERVDEGYYLESIVDEVRDEGIVFGRYDADLEPLEELQLVNESNYGLLSTRGRVGLYGPIDTDLTTLTPVVAKPQIVINLADNSSAFDYDAEENTRGPYTVIGRVVSGLSVAEEIAAVETREATAGDGTDLMVLPVETIEIIRIYRSDGTVPPDTTEPPTADAGADTSALVGDVVTLDGSASAPADPNDTLTYAWTQTSGPDVTLSDTTVAQPTFTAEFVGTFDFELTVTNSGDKSASDAVRVTVNSATNQAPVADAGEDRVVEPGEVTLDGSASSDPDGNETLSYFWEQTAGPEVSLSDPTAANPSFTTDVTGVVTFKLLVTDDQGGVATSTVTLTLNTAPTASIPADRTVRVTNRITLDGTASSDPDADQTLTYKWEFLTENVDFAFDTDADADTASPTITIPEVPSDVDHLTFQLTVTDSLGATGTATVILTVTKGPYVRFHTADGTMRFELFDTEAPITYENFMQYVEDGFYNGLIFHRVVPDFVVQAGGFQAGGEGAEGVRDPIVNEFDPERSNLRTTIAMAKISGDPDSATSQFFINLVDNTSLDTNNGGFTVFGRVVDGMEVADAMATVELNGEEPVEEIVILSTSVDIPEDDITDFITTDSGLQYRDITRGTGDPVTGEQTVSAYYTGRLDDENGESFDGTTGRPASFSLTGVIGGWTEGLSNYDFRVGGKRELIIPPDLGYGEAGSPPTIPENATLWFEVEVVDATD